MLEGHRSARPREPVLRRGRCCGGNPIASTTMSNTISASVRRSCCSRICLRLPFEFSNPISGASLAKVPTQRGRADGHGSTGGGGIPARLGTVTRSWSAPAVTAAPRALLNRHRSPAGDLRAPFEAFPSPCPNHATNRWTRSGGASTPVLRGSLGGACRGRVRWRHGGKRVATGGS